MARDWLTTTIGEQATLQRGFDITKKDQRPGTVPVVSSGGVSSYHDTAQVGGPGVVLGRKGTLGTVYYMAEDYWPHDTTLWVKDFHGNHPKFVYYFFKWKATRFLRMDVGSANPTLNRNHVHPMEIRWPRLAKQRVIAHILGTLDDKIELNRRMNETLESMARAIFKSWFVDFDPVRANIDGRQPPGMDTHTASLFPKSIGHHNGDLIPTGWRKATLGELAQNVSITYDFNSTPDVVFVNTGDVINGDFLHCNRSVKADLPGQAKKTIQPNDILFSEIRPANRRFAFVDFDASDYVVSTKFMVVRSLGEIHPQLLYRNVTSAGALREFQVIAESRSGTFPQITFDSVSHFPIVLPSEQVQVVFQAKVEPLDARIKANKRESKTLAALRDTLLPKLLSGELGIKDAERIAGGTP